MKLALPQILTQVVAFLIFLWILKRYAWGPLQAILDERQQTIKAEFDAIEKEKKEAQTLAADYREKLRTIQKEARAKIQEGVKEGEQAAKRLKEVAGKQVEEMMENAKREIELGKIKAQDALKKEIIELSFTLTSKILQEESTPEQQKKWMDKFTKGLKLK